MLAHAFPAYLPEAPNYNPLVCATTHAGSGEPRTLHRRCNIPGPAAAHLGLCLPAQMQSTPWCDAKSGRKPSLRPHCIVKLCHRTHASYARLSGFSTRMATGSSQDLPAPSSIERAGVPVHTTGNEWEAG